MRIQILASAIDDLADGRDFYDLQERGVGDYFQDCLFLDIDSLLIHAGMHRSIFGYHRLLSRRFPYAVYYRVEQPDLVTVHRVLDCRRDPARIRESLNP